MEESIYTPTSQEKQKIITDNLNKKTIYGLAVIVLVLILSGAIFILIGNYCPLPQCKCIKNIQTETDTSNSALNNPTPTNTQKEDHTTNSNLIVVSAFTKYPEIKNALLPLATEWEKEGIKYNYIEISSANTHPGRDMAEKLRNLLKSEMANHPFKYLFLIDITDPLLATRNHEIPGRVFSDTSSVDAPLRIWSDFYYSDLVGDFDLNSDGVFAVSSSLNDYRPGLKEKSVIVGRLTLDKSNLELPFKKYIVSDIQFRQNPSIKNFLISDAFGNNFRDGSSTSWPEGNALEESQTINEVARTNNIQIQKLIKPKKEILFSAIGGSNMLLFYGHGSTYNQQIDNTSQTFVEFPDLENLPNISFPQIIFFQGCEAGKVYSDNWDNCQDGSVCHSSSTIAQALLLNKNPSSQNAVAAVANSITGSSYPSDFADLISGALWNRSLAKIVLEKNWRIMAEKSIMGRTSQILVYFGDPTIPFPVIAINDTSPPKIIFNTNPRQFVAVDKESGMGEIKISYDNSEYISVDSNVLSAPYYINKYGYKKANIEAIDRAGNIITADVKLDN